MAISLHSRFLDALGKLEATDQNRVRNKLKELLIDGESKALRPHKVGDYWSFSASDSLRILALRQPDTLLMVYVDRHDSAYEWAARMKPVKASRGNFFSFVTSDSQLAIAEEARHNGAGLVARLVEAGMPRSLAEFLGAACNESELLSRLNLLSPEWQELAWKILLANQTSSQEVQGMPSDIYLVADDRELEFALRLPQAKWRVFLHPRQRFVIDNPFDRHIFLKGGPGTGKTVTVVHRFVKLLADARAKGRVPPCLVALTETTRKVLLSSIVELDSSISVENILMADELPKGQLEADAFWGRFSGVLIDEGQDAPVQYISELLSALETGRRVPAHSIAFDPNQAILSPTGRGFEKIQRFFDSVVLSYSYRCTAQNASASKKVIKHLHERFYGKDFQNQHFIDSMRDLATADYFCSLHGPAVEASQFSSKEELFAAVRKTLNRYKTLYPSHVEMPVILVADNASKHAHCTEIKKSWRPVFIAEEAKGQEYLAGAVVDLCQYPVPDPKGIKVTRSLYQSLLGTYVGVSRFRDRVACFALSPHSPIGAILR